ncbi:MAG: BON domain-containing protein [Candidatus Acidiferrales bacterium]
MKRIAWHETFPLSILLMQHLIGRSHRSRLAGTILGASRRVRGARCASADSITEKTLMGKRLVLAVLSISFAMGCAKKADDAAIITNIQSQMFSDLQLKGSDVKVTSSHGEVTLSGTVPDDAARLDAYKLALQTAGVTKVNDQMSVTSAQAPNVAGESGSTTPGSAQEPTLDSAPSRKFKAAPSSRKNQAPPKDVPPQEPARSTEDVPPPPSAIEANATPPAAPLSVVPVAPAAPTPLPQPKDVVIPASSTVSIRMIDGIDSKVNHSGEIFHASLDAPLVVGDSVVVPRGADVYVRLTSASSAGHLKGKSELHLELLKMDFQGRSYDLASDTYTEVGNSRGANTAKKVGGGAIAGALLGGLLGGGRGAAIGAGVGAGGGAVYQGATKGKQVQIPAETKLDFQLSQPVTVTVMPRADIPTE